MRLNLNVALKIRRIASRCFTTNVFFKDENMKPRCYKPFIVILKFMGQLGIRPFTRHRDSCRLEPVRDIKEMDASTRNFRAML